ncbi:MAG TPA: hypothetical protein VGZ22_10225 [Isosphaeraceae bacterium]|jgi:hypothetical protein|nr:hypothetical protein [Isosphaeraceae bacterium]
MLFISLIVSALLLLIVNWFAWRTRHPRTTIVCSSLAFMVGPLFLTCVLPTVAFQALLLCGATIAWRATRRGPSFFLPLSCGATLVAYGLSGMMVLESEREYARLRVRYPYESMEGRLPALQAGPGSTPLLPATAQRLSRVEAEIPKHANHLREFQLEALHEHAVSLFINSPGFGVARMLHPSESGLAASLRSEPVPLQPGSRFTSMWSPGDLEQLPAGDETPLSHMLEGSILDFVNPLGFGLFKDRRHVAGFETHRFSQVPAPANRWKVQTLELVSLLLHDDPEVYVSSHLPRMDRLQGVPTRPLDRFENYGLGALRQGEDIVTTQGVEGARMLGAVRSATQCVACHGGERGALLGAFSYTLRSE